MQTVPYYLLVDDQQAYLHQDTDTAHPQTPIPIYYFHTEEQPFCTNIHCICQLGRRAAEALSSQIATGHLELAQLVAGTEECYHYGHTWQVTEKPDMKECQLCGIKGYCPGCTPIPPKGATPFYCTAHTVRQVNR